MKEIKILQKLKDENIDFIPKLPDKFSGKYKNKSIYAYIVLKWDGRTLLDYIKSSEIDNDKIILNIFESLEILHDYNILYIDFNPLNFSYPELPKTIKFINFENAQMNPEIRKNKKPIGDSVWNALSFQKGGILQYVLI